jgi:hypothetical protein
MKTLPPLLVTSAINVASAHLAKLTSVTDRLMYTAYGIDNWLRIVPNLKIVICDGSGYDLSSFVSQRWPGSRIEVLSFHNDAERVAALGKGFGEGQIIDYALENSRFLAEHNVFMKCTSKLWVSNFEAILTSCNVTRFNIRAKPIGEESRLFTWVDTRFYSVTKEFFGAYLAEAYKTVNRMEKHYIEHAYLEALIGAGVVNDVLFPKKPIIKGVSGSFGVEHKN